MFKKKYQNNKSNYLENKKIINKHIGGYLYYNKHIQGTFYGFNKKDKKNSIYRIKPIPFYWKFNLQDSQNLKVKSQIYIIHKDNKTRSKKNIFGITEFYNIIEDYDFYKNKLQSKIKEFEKKIYLKEENIEKEIKTINENNDNVNFVTFNTTIKQIKFYMYPLNDPIPPINISSYDKKNNSYFPWLYIIIPCNDKWNYIRNIEHTDLDLLQKMKQWIIDCMKTKFHLDEKYINIYYKHSLHMRHKGVIFYCEYMSKYANQFKESYEMDSIISLNNILYILKHDLMEKYVFTYVVTSNVASQLGITHTQLKEMGNKTVEYIDLKNKEFNLKKVWYNNAGANSIGKQEEIQVIDNNNVKIFKLENYNNNNNKFNDGFWGVNKVWGNFTEKDTNPDDISHDYIFEDKYLLKYKPSYIKNQYYEYIKNKLYKEDEGYYILEINDEQPFQILKDEKKKDELKDYNVPKIDIGVLENINQKDFLQKIYIEGQKHSLKCVPINLNRNHIEDDNKVIDKIKKNCDSNYTIEKTTDTSSQNYGIFFHYFNSTSVDKIDCTYNKKLNFEEMLKNSSNSRIRFSSWHYKDDNNIMDGYFDMFDYDEEKKLYYMGDNKYNWLKNQIKEIYNFYQKIFSNKYIKIYCHMPGIQGFHIHFDVYNTYNDYFVYKREQWEYIKTIDLTTILQDKLNRYFINNYVYYQIYNKKALEEENTVEEEKHSVETQPFQDYQNENTNEMQAVSNAKI